MKRELTIQEKKEYELKQSELKKWLTHVSDFEEYCDETFELYKECELNYIPFKSEFYIEDDHEVIVTLNGNILTFDELVRLIMTVWINYCMK
jgi:alpha-galactosidase/6-phospho-beta-glucosidase family protein